MFEAFARRVGSRAGRAFICVAMSSGFLALAAAPAQAGPDAFTIDPTGGNGANVSWTNQGSTSENAIAIGPQDFSSNSLTDLTFPGASSCQASGSQGGWYCYVNLGPGATIVGSLTTVQAVNPGLAFVNCTTTDSFATDACQTVTATASGGGGGAGSLTNDNFATVTAIHRILRDEAKRQQLATIKGNQFSAATGVITNPFAGDNTGGTNPISLDRIPRELQKPFRVVIPAGKSVTIFATVTKKARTLLKTKTKLKTKVQFKLSDELGHQKTIVEKFTIKGKK